MHLLKYKTPPKAKNPIRILNHYEVPEYRRLNGRRFDARGNLIGKTGAKRAPDPFVARTIKAAHDAVKGLAAPVEAPPFDLARYTPLKGRVLVSQGPLIKTQGGVDLPEELWRREKWWTIVRLGAECDGFEAGERVIFQKGHKPKEVLLGRDKYFIGRHRAIAASLGS